MPSKQLRVFRPYWDACVFISSIQRTPGRVEVLDELRKLARVGQVMVVTSSIATAEVIKVKDLDKCGLGTNEEDTSKIEEDLAKIRDYLENPWITRRVVDTAIAEKAAILRRRFKLRLPDAIHLATAWHYEVDQFQTYDTDLLKLNGQVTIERKGMTLKICHPEMPASRQSPTRGESPSREQLPLFGDPEPEDADHSE